MTNGISLLPIAAVVARCGLSKSTVWAKIAAGNFPRPVRISCRRVAWSSLEIDQWIENRIAERDDGKDAWQIEGTTPGYRGEAR